MQEKPNNTPSVRLKFIADPDNKKQRLDSFISQATSHSRSVVRKLIDGGHVYVDGVKSPKASQNLSGGNIVDVYVPQVAKKELPEIKIIFENKHCLVINKPYGVLVHPADTSNEETIADKFNFELESVDYPSIVHRLDRTTSGVMVLAKTLEYRNHILSKFKQRSVTKKYLAIVKGAPKDSQFIVNAPIGRDKNKRQIFKVVSDGKESKSKFKLLASSNSESLLLIEPVTGRTHQIRAHLRFINMPIIGDRLYGGQSAERLMLHAYSLNIPVEINDKNQKFTASIEDNMQQYISNEFGIKQKEIAKLAK